MEYDEQYYGQRIRIATTQDASGLWCSTAQLLDRPGVELEREGFPSEPEARSAALSSAYAELDRLRARTGKP